MANEHVCIPVGMLNDWLTNVEIVNQENYSFLLTEHTIPEMRKALDSEVIYDAEKD